MPITKATGNVIADNSVTQNKLATITASNSPTGRSLANRFADVINVKDFGATGDGTTDDSNAFRAAFDFANTKLSSCVYIPYGTYKLNTSADGITNPWNQSNKAFNTSLVSIESKTIQKTIAIIGDGEIGRAHV